MPGGWGEPTPFPGEADRDRNTRGKGDPILAKPGGRGSGARQAGSPAKAALRRPCGAEPGAGGGPGNRGRAWVPQPRRLTC